MHHQRMISLHIRAMLLFILMWQFLFNVSDAGVSLLILFLYHLIKMFHSISPNNATEPWLKEFPTNLQSVRHAVVGGGIRFLTYMYVVCPKCHALYDFENCFITVGSRRIPNKCTYYIQYPNHPMASFRQPCVLHQLRREPLKVYSYQSLKDGVSRLLQHHGFLEKCEEW